MEVPSGRLARAFARKREGLAFVSQLTHMLGLPPAPRFAKRSLRAPDATTAWVVVTQVASGEYRWPGLTPEPGWSVVDVGANIGVFSLWAERLGATVVAFEPEPETFASLLMNIRGKRVKATQAALVGPEAGDVVRLYLSDHRSTRHTLTGREIESGLPLSESVEVPAVSLAETVGPGCDLLKLDCEGAEFSAILGADNEVLRRARRIILEFHRVAGDPQLLLDRLDGAGMETSILSGASPDDAVGMIGAVARDS